MANRLEKIEEVTAARTKAKVDVSTPEAREHALKKAWRRMKAKARADDSESMSPWWWRRQSEDPPGDLVERVKDGRLILSYGDMDFTKALLWDWIVARQVRIEDTVDD